VCPGRVDARLPRVAADIQLADAALSAALAGGAELRRLRIHGVFTSDSVQCGTASWTCASSTARSAWRLRGHRRRATWACSHAELDPDVAAETARLGCRGETTLAPAERRTTRDAAEPVYFVSAGLWTTGSIRSRRWPPTNRVLGEYQGRLLEADGVDPRVCRAAMYGKGAGTFLRRHVRLVDQAAAGEGVAEVEGDHSSTPRRARFDTMRTLGRRRARGGSTSQAKTRELTAELAQLPSPCSPRRPGAKRDGAPPDAGDRPIQPLADNSPNRIGHATNTTARSARGRLCGTSFGHSGQTRHHLRYGPPVIERDRLTEPIEYGWTTVGFDDEGSERKDGTLGRDGTFVGISAGSGFDEAGQWKRSTGFVRTTRRHHVARFQRLANVSLQPGRRGPSADDLIARVEEDLHVRRQIVVQLDMQRRYKTFQVHRTAVLPDRNGRPWTASCATTSAYQANNKEFLGETWKPLGAPTWLDGRCV